MPSWSRVSNDARYLLRWGVLAVLTALVLLLLSLGTVCVVDNTKPVSWGTFIAERTTCAPRCVTSGRWSSDDRELNLPDATLDGATLANGDGIRAGLRQGTLIGADGSTVHTAFPRPVGVWLPWVIAVPLTALVLWLAWLWRVDSRSRGYGPRHASLTDS